MIRNMFLVLGAILVALVLAETMLMFFPQVGQMGKKIEATVVEPRCYANCYTSNPRHYFPITMQVPPSMIGLQEDLSDGKIMTMYCLPYACQRRKDGYFPDRSKEIFIVGDSFTFGEGVNEQDTLGYLLGQQLTDYNIRNFGETAANLMRVFAIVRDLFESPKPNPPKTVIYFFNLNDVELAAESNQSTGRIIDFQNIRLGYIPEQRTPLMQWLARFRLVRLIEKVWIMQRETTSTIQAYKDRFSSERNSQGVTAAVQQLSAMNAFVRTQGAQLMVVAYPLLFKDAMGTYPFQEIHDWLKKTCNEHGILFIDGVEAFTQESTMSRFIVHPVDLHPNGLANQQMVQFLTKLLRDNLGL